LAQSLTTDTQILWEPAAAAAAAGFFPMLSNKKNAGAIWATLCTAHTPRTDRGLSQSVTAKPQHKFCVNGLTEKTRRKKTTIRKRDSTSERRCCEGLS